MTIASPAQAECPNGGDAIDAVGGAGCGSGGDGGSGASLSDDSGLGGTGAGSGGRALNDGGGGGGAGSGGGGGMGEFNAGDGDVDGGDGGANIYEPQANGRGGGGGGGGGTDLIDPIGPVTGTVRGSDGGSGGNGGSGTTTGGGGGGGGGGGFGLIIGTASDFEILGTVTGGNGGDGGDGGKGGDHENLVAAGGGGGAGGAGIRVENGQLTIGAGATVTGGNGGAGGLGRNFDGNAPSSNGGDGEGGAGIIATNARIITGGTIASGPSNDGAQGAAIIFDGGTNYLNFQNASSGLSGGIVLQRSASLTFDQPTDFNLVNAISGKGSVTKTGTSTLIFSGANTYTRGTNVDGGTVKGGVANAFSAASDHNIGAAGTLDLGGYDQAIGGLSGAAGARITNNGGDAATLTAGGKANTDFAGIIADGDHAVALTKTGSGTLTLTGANTYSGGTTIRAGKLQIGDGSTSGSIAGDVTTSSDTRLVFNRSDALVFDGDVSGAGALAQKGTGVTTLTGTNTYSGGTFLSGGTLSVSNNSQLGRATGTPGALTFNGGTLRVTGTDFTSTGKRDIILKKDGGTFEINDAANSLSLDGKISGAGSLTKTGSGTLVLTKSSTEFKGDIYLEGGTLSASDNKQLGRTDGDPSDLYFDGGTLRVTGTHFTNVGSRTINWQSGGGGFDIVDSANTFTVDSKLSGTGGLTKSGLGTLVLSRKNSYSGDTTISSGMLKAGGRNHLSSASTHSIGADGVLDLGGFSQAIGALSGSSGAVVTNGGSSGRDRLTAGGNDSSTTYAGTIQDGAGAKTAFTKEGTGTLTLTGENTYSGGTRVDAGTLQIGAGQASGSILGDVGVADGGTLAFNRSDRLDFSGTISGAGQLRNGGPGTLRLTGNSGGFTGTTTVAAGKLIVGTGGLGMLGGDVTVLNGATLGGSGSLLGTVTVDDGGILAPGESPGTLTIGSLVLSDKSLLSFDLDTPAGTNDLVDVTGALTLDGIVELNTGSSFANGTYRLFNYDSLVEDNGLVIAGSTAGYNFDIDTSTPNQVNLIVNYDGLQFWNGSDDLPDGNIRGGSGTWNASNHNWTDANGLSVGQWGGVKAVFAGASGGTVTVAEDVAVAGLQFRTDGYLLTGPGRIAISDPITEFGVQKDIKAEIANEITGSGGLGKSGAGTLSLTGDNSYSGATLVNSGTLALVGAGSISASSAITVDGILDISSTSAGATVKNLSGTAQAGSIVLGARTLNLVQDDDGEFAGIISGDGGIAKEGAGSLVVTGANTYSGATMVAAGMLQIGDGDTTGSVVSDIDVATGATLRFSRSDERIYSGSLSGSGAVQSSGGTLVLTGDSAGFLGSTTIEEDSALLLASTGRLGGTVTAKAGASIGGTGAIGNAVLENGSTIAPGDAVGEIGTLVVNGALTLEAGSTFVADIAGNGGSDKLAVAGTATIDGAAIDINTPQYFELGERYTLLASAGLTGTFATVHGNLQPISAFFRPEVTYDDHNAYLEVAQYRPFADAAVTPNQTATATGLNSLAIGNTLFDAVAWLPNDTEARTAFDALSGEFQATAKTVLVEDSIFLRSAVYNRLSGGQGEKTTPGIASQGSSAPGVWMQAFGAWGSIDGGGAATSVDRTAGGFFIGADMLVSQAWRIGLVGGYFRSSFNKSDHQSSGDADNYHAGIYAGRTWGALSLKAGAAYTLSDVETDRTVIFPGYADQLEAGYDAGTAQVFGEMAYDLGGPAASIQPFAGIAFVNLDTRNFTERGGDAALSSASSGTDVTYTMLGLRTATQFGLGSMRARFKSFVGWQHALGDTAPRSSLSYDGGRPFSVAGLPIAKDGLAAEAGLDIALGSNISLGVTYSGQLGGGSDMQGVRGSLSWTF